MKQCPKCSSLFPDGDKFCEVDGTILVAAEHPATIVVRDKRILPLIAVIGVSVGVLLVFVYLMFLREKTTPEASANSNPVAQQQVVTLLPSPALDAPSPLASPSVEPSPSPSPSPSIQASPSPQASATPVEFSSNPISAAAPVVSNQVIIRLVNGGKIEAEEAWQTGEGIWYRKGSVISLLDPKNVKSIDKVAPTPAPTQASSP